MKKLSKIFCSCFTVIFVIFALKIDVQAVEVKARYEVPFEVNAASYLLVSLDTGEVIFEKNSQEQRTPASLTKLMTSLMVYRYIDDIENTKITAPRYIYDELYGMGGSTADIWRGEILSAKDLLYAMLLPSGNEAANIVADYLGKGSIPNFCMMMTNEAKKLGCTNTNFSNAHGLFSNNHYTTAWDMYLIAKACYETPGFMDIATSNNYLMPANVRHDNPYYIQSTVKMQNKGSPFYRSYVRGLKTGSLPEAGHNFVTVCEKNGERYILVVMGADNTNTPGAAFVSTAQIMDHFFETYRLKNANSLTYPVTEIPLKYAREQDTLLLYPSTEVMSVLPNDVDESSFQKVYNIPESVGAPIEAGDVIGTVDYYLAGQKVGTSQLVSSISVKRSTIMFLAEKFKEVIKSLYFKVVILLTVVLLIAYFLYAYIQYKKHDKMQKVRRRRR